MYLADSHVCMVSVKFYQLPSDFSLGSAVNMPYGLSYRLPCVNMYVLWQHYIKVYAKCMWGDRQDRISRWSESHWITYNAIFLHTRYGMRFIVIIKLLETGLRCIFDPPHLAHHDSLVKLITLYIYIFQVHMQGGLDVMVLTKPKGIPLVMGRLGAYAVPTGNLCNGHIFHKSFMFVWGPHLRYILVTFLNGDICIPPCPHGASILLCYVHVNNDTCTLCM